MSTDRDPIAKALQSGDLIEELAAIEHERWSHWQRFVHEHCIDGADGSLTIPADLAGRWAAQMVTSYEDLSESEKESDREQVRRYLPTVAAALRAASVDPPTDTS